MQESGRPVCNTKGFKTSRMHPKEHITSSDLPVDHTDLAIPTPANYILPNPVRAAALDAPNQKDEAIIKALNNLHTKSYIAVFEARSARRHRATLQLMTQITNWMPQENNVCVTSRHKGSA